MARTAIPIQTVPANGGGIAGLTFTAADQANGMQFPNDGRTLLLIKNTDASPHNVTVKSVPDRFQRSGDTIVAAPASTTVSIAGPFQFELFQQTTGVVNVDFASATGMTVAAVQLAPGNP